MRDGRTGKIHIDEDDEIEMIEDLRLKIIDDKELLTKIGYYDREEFSKRRPVTRASCRLNALRRGINGFYPNELIELLRLYQLHYPGKYEKLLALHRQEYSKLFSKAGIVLEKNPSK